MGQHKKYTKYNNKNKNEKTPDVTFVMHWHKEPVIYLDLPKIDNNRHVLKIAELHKWLLMCVRFV